MEYRVEHDSMGEVKVPADKYWAAQTERSHENFLIGVGIETMPREITHAFGILKKAAALANAELKPERMTASGVSSMIRSMPVAVSSARILRPSRPMMRPFISSLGRLTTDTVVSAT